MPAGKKKRVGYCSGPEVVWDRSSGYKLDKGGSLPAHVNLPQQLNMGNSRPPLAEPHDVLQAASWGEVVGQRHGAATVRQACDQSGPLAGLQLTAADIPGQGGKVSEPGEVDGQPCGEEAPLCRVVIGQIGAIVGNTVSTAAVSANAAASAVVVAVATAAAAAD